MDYSLNRKTFRCAVLSLVLLAAVAASPSQLVRSADDENNIEKFALKRVQPPYPAMAQKYKIEGIVTVQITVDKDGKVGKAEFVRGHNIFRSVSLDAAKRWEFKRPEGDLAGIVHFTFKLDQ